MKNAVRSASLDLLTRLDDLEAKLSKSLQPSVPSQLEDRALRYRHLQFARECRAYFETHSSSQARFPDFMIIGTPRAAGTWSKKIFTHTEEVLFCLGEPRYFSKYFFDDASCYFGRLEPATPDNFQCGARFSDYSRLIQGEKDPDYLCLPELQIKLIKTLMPQLRPILLVRDPIDACWSNLLFEFNRPDGKPWRRDIDIRSADRSLLEHSCVKWRELWSYRASLERWRKCYKNILLVFFEDIAAEPEREARRIIDYVGASYKADPDVAPIGQRVNEAPAKIGWTDQQFQFLRRLFAEEYDHWHGMFGRPPRY